MSEIWIVEKCEHGNIAMHDYRERELWPGCPGGSRQVVELTQPEAMSWVKAMLDTEAALRAVTEDTDA